MIAINEFGLRFHHLGLASRCEDKSVKFLEGLGYNIGDRIHDPLQSVYLRLCENEFMPDVEIVAPTDNPGPLDNILSGAESNFYHVCYETTNLIASLEAIKGSGIRVICVSEAKPAVLFDGRYVSFYTIRGLGLVELLETNDSRKTI